MDIRYIVCMYAIPKEYLKQCIKSLRFHPVSFLLDYQQLLLASLQSQLLFLLFDKIHQLEQLKEKGVHLRSLAILLGRLRGRSWRQLLPSHPQTGARNDENSHSAVVFCAEQDSSPGNAPATFKVDPLISLNQVKIIPQRHSRRLT